jgi:hypothetical protein
MAYRACGGTTKSAAQYWKRLTGQSRSPRFTVTSVVKVTPFAPDAATYSDPYVIIL